MTLPAHVQVATWWPGTPDDGTPHTKHLTTNLILDIDNEAGTASARSCYCVLQAVSPDFPLQPIITGRYHDTSVRDGQNWHFRAGASSPIRSDPWDTTS